MHLFCLQAYGDYSVFTNWRLGSYPVLVDISLFISITCCGQDLLAFATWRSYGDRVRYLLTYFSMTLILYLDTHAI